MQLFQTRWKHKWGWHNRGCVSNNLVVEWTVEGRLDVKKNHTLERNKKQFAFGCVTLNNTRNTNGGRKKCTKKHLGSWRPRVQTSTPSERVLVRSQSGLGAGVVLFTSPSSPLTRIESPLFRVFIQRRLRLPFPLSERMCRCGHFIDSHGHYRAACSRTGR